MIAHERLEQANLPSRGSLWLALGIFVTLAVLCVGLPMLLAEERDPFADVALSGFVHEFDGSAQAAALPQGIRENNFGNLPAGNAVRVPLRERARLINAAVPFSKAPFSPAPPMVVNMASPDRNRAIDCLAAAGWYEAGNDPSGQMAVMQVVLNRVRHPAFPNTICGTVFQGSDRATGCQFTFTCDGAMARKPSAAAWNRARNNADFLLNGFVYQSVGLATHYHTDWVTPEWSPKLDKIAVVGTHLFFRWPGGMGKPGAFTSRIAGVEPRIPAMTSLSAYHRADETMLASAPDRAVGPQPATQSGPDLQGDVQTPRLVESTSPDPAGVAPPAATVRVSSELLRGNILLSGDFGKGDFNIGIRQTDNPGALALVALDLCRKYAPRSCTVSGFVGSSKRADFRYLRNTMTSKERVVWNCDKFERSDPSQCMA